MSLAGKTANRVEGQIDGANITQATVAFGVATEKDNAAVFMNQHGLQ